MLTFVGDDRLRDDGVISEGGERRALGGVRGYREGKDAQGTPTQSHLSPSILVYEDMQCFGALLSTGSFVGADKRSILRETFLKSVSVNEIY